MYERTKSKKYEERDERLPRLKFLTPSLTPPKRDSVRRIGVPTERHVGRTAMRRSDEIVIDNENEWFQKAFEGRTQKASPMKFTMIRFQGNGLSRFSARIQNRKTTYLPRAVWVGTALKYHAVWVFRPV